MDAGTLRDRDRNHQFVGGPARSVEEDLLTDPPGDIKNGWLRG